MLKIRIPKQCALKLSFVINIKSIQPVNKLLSTKSGNQHHPCMLFIQHSYKAVHEGASLRSLLHTKIINKHIKVSPALTILVQGEFRDRLTFSWPCSKYTFAWVARSCKTSISKL